MYNVSVENAVTDFIGLDLGGTFLKAARVAPDGVVGRRLREPLESDSADGLLSQLARAVGMLEQEGAAPAVGLGIPGIVEPVTGLAHGVPNLPSLEGVPLAAELAARCGRPSFAANDANAAALAEAWLGAGQDVAQHAATSAWAPASAAASCWTGGCSWATPGTRARSGTSRSSRTACRAAAARGDAWRRSRARRAGCGARRRRMAGRALRPGGAERSSRRSSWQAARAGDAVAIEVVDGAARALGAGIAATLNLLNVERVVIGGGVAAAGAILLDRVVAETRQRTFPAVFAGCSVPPLRAGRGRGRRRRGARRRCWPQD